MECTRIYICGKDCAPIRLQTFALSAAALILLCLTMLPAARAETVVTRERVGNNSEGVTYVASGHWKNRVVAIDGNDVLAINLGGPGDESEDPPNPVGLINRALCAAPAGGKSSTF